MSNLGARILAGNYTGINERTPLTQATARWRARRLPWKRRVLEVAQLLTLPVVFFALLIAIVSIPLSAKATRLGSGWIERVYAGGSVVGTGNTIPWSGFANTRIAFTGTLAPSIGRTSVTLVVQQVSGGDTTTVGSMTTPATRVFNTQPAALPVLFTTMGITARPGATYTIAVNAGSGTLTRETITLGR